jgi:putative membrane protein
MFRGLIYFVVNVLIILLLSNILPGFKVSTIWAATMLIVVLTLLNWTLGVILKFFTFPLNFLSFGLLGFLINLFVLWISLNIPQGITVSGTAFEQFILLLIITIGLSVGQAISHAMFPDND